LYYPVSNAIALTRLSFFEGTTGVLKVIDRIELLSSADVLATVTKEEAIESVKVQKKAPKL
jgi:hypothetical protein